MRRTFNVPKFGPHTTPPRLRCIQRLWSPCTTTTALEASIWRMWPHRIEWAVLSAKLLNLCTTCKIIHYMRIVPFMRIVSLMWIVQLIRVVPFLWFGPLTRFMPVMRFMLSIKFLFLLQSTQVVQLIYGGDFMHVIRFKTNAYHSQFSKRHVYNRLYYYYYIEFRFQCIQNHHCRRYKQIWHIRVGTFVVKVAVAVAVGVFFEPIVGVEKWWCSWNFIILFHASKLPKRAVLACFLWLDFIFLV